MNGCWTVSYTHLRSVFSDEFLEEINKNLPEQPWPKGIHLDVSRKMKISPQKAAIAIGKLMKQKDAKMRK